MSATIRVAVDAEWNRSDRAYERKFGVGFGQLFKDLRAVQTLAFEDTHIHDIPNHRVTSLPVVSCSANAIPVSSAIRARPIRGEPDKIQGKTTKDYYSHTTLTTQVEPLWSHLSDFKILHPPDLSGNASKDAEPVLHIVYTDGTTRNVTMRTLVDGDISSFDVRDVTTLSATDNIVNPYVKLVYTANGRQYVTDNKKPYGQETVFRVMQKDEPSTQDRCYANKLVKQNLSRCPVNVPFMPTSRVPIVGMLREGLIFDVKDTDGGVYTVRAKYEDDEWKLMKLSQALIDMVNADLSRSRSLRILNLPTLHQDATEYVRPINVVSVRGPHITDFDTVYQQQNGRCETTRWKKNVNRRARFARQTPFFTQSHVGMNVVFEFDYEAGTCHAILSRGGERKRAPISFGKGAPEDGFGGRIDNVVRDSITVLSPLDGLPHTLPNPMPAVPNDTFVYTLDEMRRGLVSYRDFALHTSRLSSAPSMGSCCEVTVVARSKRFSETLDDGRLVQRHGMVDVVLPIGDDAPPFYFRMRRTADQSDGFDFFCNTRVHDSVAISAYVRAHDTPIDVTIYRPPRFKKELFRSASAIDTTCWDVRQADGYHTGDATRQPSVTNMNDDTAWTDYGHRHEDDALITLQHHLDFKCGPSRFLVLANPTYSYRHDGTDAAAGMKVTPDGLVLRLPLIVVQTGRDTFQIEEQNTERQSEDGSTERRPWRIVLAEFFEGCPTHDLEAPEVDSNGRCSVPLQLLAGIRIQCEGASYKYNPYKWELLWANVEAKSHMTKSPMREKMLTSVAQQALTQQVLINGWDTYPRPYAPLKKTYVVSWSPKFSTVYTMDRVVSSQAGAELRKTAGEQASKTSGVMVRSAVRRRAPASDLPPPLDASIAVNRDTMRCVSSKSEHKDTAAVTMRVLHVWPMTQFGRLSDDGAILREIQCTDTTQCSLIYDDGIRRQPARLLQTPMCTLCLDDDAVTPTRRLYLIDATLKGDALAFVVAEHIESRRWSIHDTLARAIGELGLKHDALVEVPVQQPQFEMLGTTSVSPNHLLMQPDASRCALNFVNIPASATGKPSGTKSDAYAFMLNTSRDIKRHMLRLPNVHADQKTNGRAFLNWWCDLMLLIAICPNTKTYHISIDPSLATLAFKKAAVEAVVFFVDMTRDAAETIHLNCSPHGRRWRRLTHNEEATPLANAAMIRPLLEAAWAREEEDAIFLEIDAPPFPYSQGTFVQVTHPHKLTEARFAPACDQSLYSADYQLLRTIFKGKARPIFKDVQLEKRVQERIALL